VAGIAHRIWHTDTSRAETASSSPPLRKGGRARPHGPGPHGSGRRLHKGPDRLHAPTRLEARGPGEPHRV